MVGPGHWRCRATFLLAVAALAVAAPTAARAAGVLAVPDRTPRASAAQEPPAGMTYTNPVFAQSFPDPMAVWTGVDYYAYGTGGRFPVLHSTDLVHWERRGTAFAQPVAWSRGENPWAPSALATPRPCPGSDAPGCYLLYYVGLNRALQPPANCIGVAHAVRPGGPFTDLGILDAAAGRPGYAATILASPGLEGYWRLGERTGGVIVDALGRRPGAYVGSPRLGAEGAIGDDPDTAVAFEAPGQRGRLPRTVTDDLSLSFWFRSQRGGAGDRLGSWRAAAGLVDARAAGARRDFGTALDAAGRVWAGTGSPDSSIHSEPGYDDGAWHHVVFTRTRATGRIHLFLDGAEVAAGTGGTRSLTAARELTVAGAVRGALDEVAVWGRALSAAEVANQFNRPPVGCADAAGWSTIDPAPFVDADGRAYLYVSTTNPERVLGVVPLAEDLVHAAGPRVPLLGASEPWEQAPWAPVVEAPWMVRRSTPAAAAAPYYLFYSGGAYTGDYAMGYATAPTPVGPFAKSPDNPILTTTAGVIGPGGGSVVTGPRTGADHMLYHARVTRGGPRLLFLDRLAWDDPRVTVAGPTTTPQPLP